MTDTDPRIEAAAKAILSAWIDRGSALPGSALRWEFTADATAALAAADAVRPIGDEYHTMDELYEYRMLYHAHATQGWLAMGIPVVKSRKHSDGEPCFGGGWFIVVATLPSGQVSNHYKDEHWDLFRVPEVDLPPEYDGHTPQDAAQRLYMVPTADVVAPSATPETRFIKMTLGELVVALRGLPEGALVRGFDSFISSYRGYYERNSVAPRRLTYDARDVAKDLEDQIGKDITGWKGGAYTVDANEGIYLANESDTGPCFAGLIEVEPGVYEPVVVEDGRVWG